MTEFSLNDSRKNNSSGSSRTQTDFSLIDFNSENLNRHFFKANGTKKQNEKLGKFDMTCEHSFNIELAKIVGIEKAILLKNIHWWILKNAKNEKNLRNGRYWTFNSARAFTELFPYMSKRSISRWLKELESDGWIEIKNFNKRKNDTTNWYGLGEKLNELCKKMNWEVINDQSLASQNGKRDCQIGKSVSQNDQRDCQNGAALPDVSTDVNKDVVAVVLQEDHDKVFEELKKIDLEDSRIIEDKIENLFTLAEIPHTDISTYRVVQELAEIRKELTKDEIWSIIINSFIEVSGKDENSKNVNYLLAKIKGKKNDLYLRKKRSIHNSELKIQNANNEKQKGIEMARKEFEKVKDRMGEGERLRIENMLGEGKWLWVMGELE
ncbi:MAG: hypothetical protein JEY94_15400 [Melioribacteraceae bacterium]|nr:hypothetical protein [Melioribacteraceae bacterium]